MQAEGCYSLDPKAKLKPQLQNAIRLRAPRMYIEDSARLKKTGSVFFVCSEGDRFHRLRRADPTLVHNISPHAEQRLVSAPQTSNADHQSTNSHVDVLNLRALNPEASTKG